MMFYLLYLYEVLHVKLKKELYDSTNYLWLYLPMDFGEAKFKFGGPVDLITNGLKHLNIVQKFNESLY